MSGVARSPNHYLFLYLSLGGFGEIRSVSLRNPCCVYQCWSADLNIEDVRKLGSLCLPSKKSRTQWSPSSSESDSKHSSRTPISYDIPARGQISWLWQWIQLFQLDTEETSRDWMTRSMEKVVLFVYSIADRFFSVSTTVTAVHRHSTEANSNMKKVLFVGLRGIL